MLLIELLVLSALFIGVRHCLRALALFDLHLAPLGARRIVFQKTIGDDFPVNLGQNVSDHDELLVICLTNGCFLCNRIAIAINAVSRTYSDLHFAVLSSEELSYYQADRSNISTIVDHNLVFMLKIGMYPYAMRVSKGRIIEHGIVNSLEHLESLCVSAMRVTI